MLPVFYESVPVGEVLSRENGPAFRYREDWTVSQGAFPVSLSMPINKAESGAERVIPWLMNLLPEGEPLRAMSRALGIAAEDVVGMIMASGRDIAGALSFRAPAEEPGYLSIDDSCSLERIINELPARPFLAGNEGVAMSLAGAQDKLPVHFSDGVLSVPLNGAASTHILKPDNPRLPGSVQNEALCMVLARRCGLPTAEITTGIAGARSFVLVTRYDRLVESGKVLRQHQEDFCQALGRGPAEKYQRSQTGRQGPSIPDMFAVIRDNMTARDTNRFLDAVIFNIAIGNVDSHAKNYSILLHPDRTELAPLYDLMSGLAWDGITENHAQDIGGQRRGRHVQGRHWRRMAEASGVSATATLRRVSAISEKILAELTAAHDEVAAMPAGEGVLLDEFVRHIAERAELVARNLRQGDEVDQAEEETPDPGARYDTH
ncbi:MAG: type II toxin-antitoxin system HipA family toxin [Hyphomonas sp.]|uniref:type II toxin-antitoxin system HipA family toxin n=1 Tax=Hyphomonas sp. TaxID=87 RepID=UPI003527912D